MVVDQIKLEGEAFASLFFGKNVKKIFYADLRTLAIVRFLLGLLVFYDFFRKFQYSHVFYSDGGILNRSVLLGKFHNIWKPSLLFLNGTQAYAIFLLLIGLLASIFYSFGVRTRLSNFVIWIILISFHERFSLAMNAGDVLITLLVFWSFFLPMNAVASWDSAWNQETDKLPKDFQVTSIFTMAWIGQIFFVYFFTFLFKWHPDWFKEGTTLYYALQLESFTTPFGRWLLQFPGLLKFLSISTLWLEGIGPWLIFIPVFNHYFRMGVMFAFIGLHLGIAATMTVGPFAICCMIMWLILLPSNFWNLINKLVVKNIPKDPLTVFYDKDCGFCKKMVFIFSNILCVQNVSIKSSSEDNKIHSEIVKNSSWAGVNKLGQIFFHWDNFLELLRYSPLPFVERFFRLIPLGLGRNLYYVVAKNRPFFTRLLFQIGYSKSWLRPSWGLTAFGIFIFLLGFSYNLETYFGKDKFSLGRPLKRVSYLLRLNQKWDMFAPYPSRSEGWFVVDGTLDNGDKWDPWRNKPVDFSRPKNIGDEFPSNVWRKVLLRIKDEKKKDYRLYIGKYICREWNHSKRKKTERIQTFDIYFMEDRTHAPGDKPYEIKKRKIWGHYCYKK